MFKRSQSNVSGSSFYKKLVASIVFGILLVGVSACSPDSGDSAENSTTQSGAEETYTIDDFTMDMTFSSPIMEEAFQHYQTLLIDFQMADFADDVGENEDVATINDVLNSFDAGVEPQYIPATAQEQYLFYAFSSEEPLVADAKMETELTKEAYLAVFFVDGEFSNAGIYSNETVLKNDDILSNEQAEDLLTEESSLADLGAQTPQITAVTQMIFEGEPHYAFAIPALTGNGNQMVHFALFDEVSLKSKDVISQKNLTQGVTTAYNAMLDDLLEYYASDILEMDMPEPEKAPPTGGGLIPIEELEENVDQLMSDVQASTPDDSVTKDKVKEFMPEPTQSTGSSDRYHAQQENGNVLIVTVFYEDDNIVEIAKQLQTKNQDFPFTETDIESIGQLPVSTPIGEITEMYGQPHLLSYRVSEGINAYIWTNENSEISNINLVQVIVNPDQSIASFNYTTF